ncbi:MAG: 50S ribosomal protein L11 methyltransferase [Syntrophomonadaceae bacterium]|nr:50S ribosomal protein L11 methyltransferase [Syntrophomonadaceae bacterium]MDD3890458.1 50S ribosomal protein L11 methyltransferase [Syntrophomonadaceae bacterium]MDD4549479.1 50S ribosomal protein L11 methyltransferase [Syntrophomonadaceae bacterium]
MNWKEISVLTGEICVEAIADIFNKLGSGGVIIEDPQAAGRYDKKDIWFADSVAPDVLDYKFVIVKAYFPEDTNILDELKSHLESVQQTFNMTCKVIINEVKNEDWEESWKEYYHTFKIGRLVIKPSWEDYQLQASEVLIEIDPGMAFGTGIHASTRFCLKFIDQYIKGGEKIIDAGCGSGILSIGAARLGAARITAMDVDDVAVKIARENIKLNQLENIIEVRTGDITEKIEHLQADIILANITADIINLLIPGAAKVLAPGGYFFGSGIIDSCWPGVKKQLEENGFEIERILKDTDWIGVAARKI